MPLKIDKIVVHCSDSPHRGDTAADVHRWHLERGWSGIGYHYTITEKGVVEAGRPHYWTGSHVRGHNTGTLGIMLFGVDYFTPEQYTALSKLLQYLIIIYPNVEVLGHSDLDPHKACPNFDVRKWWGQEQANEQYSD